MEDLIKLHWMPHIQVAVNHFYCGKVFYSFFFEWNEDRENISGDAPVLNELIVYILTTGFLNFD